MSLFYIGQRVRYVGPQPRRLDGSPPAIRPGDTGIFQGKAEPPLTVYGSLLVKMDNGADLVCEPHQLEPIVPDGLESTDKINELFEPEPELVYIEKRRV